jgi:hypothetical protein
MQILNTENSILFKDNDYYPIPQFYFITASKITKKELVEIIKQAVNIKGVKDLLMEKQAEFNIIRIDEVTHISSHEMVY